MVWIRNLYGLYIPGNKSNPIGDWFYPKCQHGLDTELMKHVHCISPCERLHHCGGVPEVTARPIVNLGRERGAVVQHKPRELDVRCDSCDMSDECWVWVGTPIHTWIKCSMKHIDHRKRRLSGSQNEECDNPAATESIISITFGT